MAQNLPPNLPQPPPVADEHATLVLDRAYGHQVGPVTANTLVARASSRGKKAEELYQSQPPSLSLDEFGQQESFYLNSANPGPAQTITAPTNAQLNNLAIQADLATKADLAQAIAPMATKADLAQAIAPMVTQADLAQAIAPMATKADLAQAIAPINAQLNNMPRTIAPIVAQLIAPIVAQLIAPIVQNSINQAIAPIVAQLHNLNARQANSVVILMDDQVVPIQNAAGLVPPNFPPTLHALNSLTNAAWRNLLVFYGCPADPFATREQRLKQFLGIRL